MTSFLDDDYDLAVFHADVSVPVKCFPWNDSKNNAPTRNLGLQRLTGASVTR
jgi:hypothetical protein